jgi:hypothetical protein
MTSIWSCERKSREGEMVRKRRMTDPRARCGARLEQSTYTVIDVGFV